MCLRLYLMHYTSASRPRPNHESSRPIRAPGVLTVAAMVVLTGCLSGHAKLGGDLWPPDA
jgi:hypothetical protein